MNTSWLVTREPAPANIRRILSLPVALRCRIAGFLERRGLGGDADPNAADPLAGSNARLYAASAQGRIPDGEHAGQRTTRTGTPIDAAPSDTSSCAVAAGMSLHAGV